MNTFPESGRKNEFFSIIDRIAAGQADDRPSTELLPAYETAAMAVVGEQATIDPDFIASGSTSVVRALDLHANGSSRRYAMRIQPEGSPADYTHAENLAREQAARVGVRTPKIYASDQDISGDKPPFSFTIEDFTEGTPGYGHYRESGFDPDVMRRLSVQMGLAVASLQHVKIEQGYGFFDEARAANGQLVGQHRTYRNHVLSGRMTALSRCLELGELSRDQAGELWKYFENDRIFDQLGSQQTVLLHGDLAPYNFTIPPTNTIEDAVLVDFGESRAGPSVHDLASASVGLARVGELSHIDSILEGYEAGGGVLPKRYEESIRAIRLRYMLSVIACQATVIANGTEEQAEGMTKYLEFARQTLIDDADALGLF